jgi:hypothetical protein
MVNIKYFFQYDIYSFGKPAISKEHWLQIYPPVSHIDHLVSQLETPQAVFLVVCDPPMNELWVT